MGPLRDGTLDETTSYNSFLFFGLKMICFNDITGWKPFSPEAFKYQPWEELFLFQGYVIALGLDASILRNTKLLSFILVPIYGFGSTASYKKSVGLQKVLGGKCPGLSSNSPRK